MRWMIGVLLIALLFSGTRPVHTQGDGLDLPTELYVLRNSGIVEQFGVGMMGAKAITPEDIFVLDFAIAPDNTWMAYRTPDEIVLSRIDTPTTLQIEPTGDMIPPLRGLGDTMAWSHKGDALAYTTPYGARVAFNIGGEQPEFRNIPNSALINLSWSPGGTFLAAEAENNIWWFYRRDGLDMLLTGALPSSYGITWLDDGQLIFAPGEGGLLVLDLKNLNTQWALQDSSRQYRLPQVRPDGSIVVFSRPIQPETPPETEDTGEAPPGLGLNSAYWQRLSLENDTAAVVASSEIAVDVSSAHWSPNGLFLIALRQNRLGIVLAETGVSFVLPVEDPVAYSWGASYPMTVSGVASGYDGFFLATDPISGVKQVWRLPADGSSPTLQTTGETPVAGFAVSARTRQIAYFSDSQLWTIPVNDDGNPGEATLLTPVHESARDAAFSPDGRTVAYADAEGIWMMVLDATAPERILQSAPAGQPGDHYTQPQYAPNVNALLVVSYPGEISPFYWYDIASGERLDIGLYDRLHWISDGRLLGYGNGVHLGEWPPIASVFLIDPSVTPPQVWTVLQADAARVLDAQVIASSRISVVLTDNRQFGPLELRLVGVELTGGDAQTLADPGFMIEPRISPDGAYLAGLTMPGGRILIYDVSRSEKVVLRMPGGVETFIWVTF